MYYVRAATLDDAAVLARMLNIFDGSDATPEQVAARMQACQHVLHMFIGAVDGQPAGFACLRLVPHIQGDAPYAELTDIFVDETFRRRGVARALLAHVDGVAQAAGATELVLLTGFDNDGAQATYRAAGYERWALAMRRSIENADDRR